MVDWQADRRPDFPSSDAFSDFSDHGILSETGEVLPVRSLKEWADWVATGWEKNRRVGETSLNGFRVSTVFLCLNHNFFGEGKPEWFETMVFIDEEHPPPPELGEKLRDGAQGMVWRYATWQEAEEGHAAVVEMIRHGLF